MFMVQPLVIGEYIVHSFSLLLIFYFFINLNRFEINLANSRGDVVLHVNPRVNDRQLVLNSAPGGNWGSEERKPLNITRGQPFTFIIMVTEQGFKVRSISKDKSNRFLLLYYFQDCRK
jgi:hypothetical protein